MTRRDSEEEKNSSQVANNNNNAKQIEAQGEGQQKVGNSNYFLTFSALGFAALLKIWLLTSLHVLTLLYGNIFE